MYCMSVCVCVLVALCVYNMCVLWCGCGDSAMCIICVYLFGIYVFEDVFVYVLM